eukprot:931026-Rhodomonas_salina.1
MIAASHRRRPGVGVPCPRAVRVGELAGWRMGKRNRSGRRSGGSKRPAEEGGCRRKKSGA